MVAADQPAPPDWSGCRRVEIGAGADLDAVVTELRDAARAREGLVISLAADADLDATPNDVDDREPYVVGVDHTFPNEHLHHLVWSNAVHAAGPGRWPLVDVAVARGASVVPTGEDG